MRWVLGNPQVFLNTTSDATVMRRVLDLAEGDLTRPTDADMQADVDAQDMAPLFDGGAIERI